MFPHSVFSASVFPPSVFPPDASIATGGSLSQLRANRRRRGLVLEAQRQQEEKVNAIRRKLSAQFNREVLDRVDFDLLDVLRLENAVASAFAIEPATKRKVTPKITISELTLSEPVLEIEDNQNAIRLILLLSF